jgi:hypothetical protein
MIEQTMGDEQDRNAAKRRKRGRDGFREWQIEKIQERRKDEKERRQTTLFFVVEQSLLTRCEAQFLIFLC